MLRPTEEELRAALAEAERLREHGVDPHHLARALLYLARRVARLEAVFEAARDYLEFGQEEHQHAVLVNAIEAARGGELQDSEGEGETFGL